jgi:hypothetical protein
VDLTGLIHHNDAGSQYTSIAFTERLAALGMKASIGTVGDAYDNALAESTIGLYKTELIRRRGPGGPWTTSRSRPWSTSTGSTTGACTPSSATSHPLSARTTTTVKSPRRRHQKRQNRASTETGAVHSLAQSRKVIDDYADTAGKRRKENDRTHGTQPGDPDRAAQAIFSTVEGPTAPFRLLLGSDAVQIVREELQNRIDEIDAWTHVSTTSDFPGGDG